jgi:aminotransferase
LGRRLGWLIASPDVIDGVERVQQCSLLCADTLSQQTMSRYLSRAIPDGSLRRYIDETNALYRDAAQVTLRAIDTHIGLPRLTPMGALYTVMDVRTDADAFVPRALKETGVLVVPGGGFGPSLKTGVRISYGPLVNAPEKIEEGIARLGRWMQS